MATPCRPIRILRAIFLSALLLAIPLGTLAAVIGNYLIRSFTPAFIVDGVLMATYFVSSVALAFWPCPQCHKRFVRFNIFWPRRCARCGHPC